MAKEEKLSDKDFERQFAFEVGRYLKTDNWEEIDKVLKTYDDEDDFKRRLIKYSNAFHKLDKVSVNDYIRAVHFCVLYSQGLSQLKAYTKIFPERAARKDNGTSTLANSANIYFHNMIVQEIWKQMTMSDHVMFQDKRFKAYLVLEEIMDDPESTRKEKIDAASKLANLLATPKEATLRIDNTSQNKELKALEDKLSQMAEMQLSHLMNGKISNKDIVEAELIEKVEEFDPEIHDIEVYEKYEIIVKKK